MLVILLETVVGAKLAPNRVILACDMVISKGHFDASVIHTAHIFGFEKIAGLRWCWNV